MTPSPAETTGSGGLGMGSEMRMIRAEGLLRLGMTMGGRGAPLRHVGGGASEGEEGAEWEGEGGVRGGGGYYGGGGAGWGNAVESVAALSLRDDVDYSRPVAAVSSFLHPGVATSYY